LPRTVQFASDLRKVVSLQFGFDYVAEAVTVRLKLWMIIVLVSIEECG
jgi:hypothetical protein